MPTDLDMGLQLENGVGVEGVVGEYLEAALATPLGASARVSPPSYQPQEASEWPSERHGFE